MTGSCAQNKDWFPEWESAGGWGEGEANPALTAAGTGGPRSPGGEWEMEQTFRSQPGIGG